MSSGRTSACVFAFCWLIGAFWPAWGRAEEAWHWTASVEDGRPEGWVQVRENEIEGTRLHFSSDLDAQSLRGLRVAATKERGERSEWHLSLATYMLDGSTQLAQPITFNGATIAPGRLVTATRFTHFLRFDTSWWHRLAAFENGGGLWGSAGLTFVLLDFTLHGTVAAGSAGQETHEMFYVQELPVPMLGLHLRYPLTREKLSLVVSADAGRLPDVNSLRQEGGTVRLGQTNADVSIGISDRLTPKWQLTLSAFSRNYAQEERSDEDHNRIRLRSRGVMLGVGHAF